MSTPIEAIETVLGMQQVREDIVVDEVLVPEQCMRIYIDGKPYHLTLEALPE